MLRAARAYAKAAGVPLRTVSRRAYGDSRFFASLARGSSFSAPNYDKIMGWLADPARWPDGAVSGAVVDPFAAVEKESAP